MKKPGLDPDQPENFRPISNLPFLSKVLERIVFSQIEHYLNDCNLLPRHQSAYRKFHSTETLLARVVSDLISDASNGKHTLLAMLDLSAAFDTVDHTILIKRLSLTFGINDTALQWFSSYLSAGADPGIYFGGPNQVLQSKIEGEARIEGAKRPRIEGEARVKGAKRLKIEGEARTEGEAREKTGGGVWGGGSVSPSPEIF